MFSLVLHQKRFTKWCARLNGQVASTNKILVFTVLACTCSFITKSSVTGSARQLDSRVVQQLSRVTCGIRVMTASFFLFCLQFFFCLFCCWSHVCHGRSGAWICPICLSFPCRVSPSCLHCACIATIDAPMTIIVVSGWVSLWYSQWPQDALVLFVGEASLWLWGWLPQPSALHLRGLSCERFGASRWRCWSHLSRSVMALIVSFAIGHVIVNCCCLSQLRLDPMLALP